jgi:glycosyltransferase involved in cell wall biosynthesis
MKISIITVNLNNADGLAITIHSVRRQTNTNYEFIIIDGNSTDNSKEIIESNKDIINYYVSESDEGLYYAMNKGLDKASGDFALFLNSGDVLHDAQVLEDVMEKITSMNTVYFGSAKVFNAKGGYYLYPKVGSSYGDIKNFLTYYRPNHQATFFPKKFYMLNRYDVRYKVAADEDYKIRALKECGYIFFGKIIVSFVLGGLSYPVSLKRVKKISREMADIHRSHNLYNLKNHIRLLVSLFIKCLLYCLFGDKSYKLLTASLSMKARSGYSHKEINNGGGGGGGNINKNGASGFICKQKHVPFVMFN